jgi:hypothetical protein
MDHQSIAQLLGNYGEFVGALAVVATLFYLAVQIRHSREATEAHTRSMEESRKVALAQAYQDRAATRLQLHFIMAESDHLAPIETKLLEEGWPANQEALDRLEPLERTRYVNWTWAGIVRLDTSFYYRRLGILDEEAWKLTSTRMRQMAPTFQKLGMERGVTEQFADEMRRMAADIEAKSN